MQKSAKKLGLALFVMLLCLLVRPMQVNAGNVRTGTLGENNGISWTYDEDTKTLTITGEDSGLQGTYDSATWSYKSPFAAICEDVEVIKVQNCTLKGSCTGLFAGLESLKSIEFQNFDTSHIISMYFMFYNCSSLSSVDLSNFDTSKVTDMSCMFEGCSSLSSLDVSNFDTSRVSDMNCMFSGCSSLSTLDLSNFDTSYVTNMSCMFEGCSSLSSVDVSNFDTSYVTNMRCMFEGCSSLSSVDVSNFDTSNAYYMNGMFYGCSSLSSLDVSKFNTSKVEYMGDMFFGCSSLNSLDLSNFDTSRVTNMSCMFEGCSSLSSLDVSNFDTSNVTDMSYMFRECSGLSSLDVSNFNTGNVTDMSGMFYDCSSLNSLDVSNFNTGNVTSMRYMFDGCGSLTGLDISSFDLTKVTSTDRAFKGCTNLARIKTPKTMPVSLSIDLPSTYMDTKKNQTKELTKAFCNTTLINVNYLVSEIKLNSSSITVQMGKTEQLTATVSPQQALDKTLTWKSSNTAVATVDSNGKVTAVGAGNATITATAKDGSGKSAICEVTVTRAMSEQEKKVRAFVERMYTVALGRAAEEDGLDFYTERLLAGDSNGACLAQSFLCSPEFINKGYDDAQYVKMLYKTFFDREPAAEEVNYWVGQLNGGKSRAFVLAGFVNSVEFDNLCASYGISRGFMLEDGNPINPGIGRFAERLYTVVLERAGEKDGIEFWSLNIANGVCTPKDAAKNFFLSPEYINKNTSDAKYITTLYKAFMDREPEEGGVEYWQNVLNNGATREQILEGFADSAEFKAIMANFGL